jgi:hypothetical protein
MIRAGHRLEAPVQALLAEIFRPVGLPRDVFRDGDVPAMLLPKCLTIVRHQWDK